MDMKKSATGLLILLMLAAPARADGPCSDLGPDSTIDDCTYEIDSGKLNNMSLALAYLRRAEAWNEKGGFDQALADSEHVLKLSPTNLEASAARGLAWQGKGEYDKAIADYSHIIEHPPADHNSRYFILPIAYMRRGAAWGLKGEMDKAIADASEAINLRFEGNYPRALYNRALAWKAKGEYAKAMADYWEAIRLNPADPHGLIALPAQWKDMDAQAQAETLFQGLEFSGIETTSPEVAWIYQIQETRFGKVLLVASRGEMMIPGTILFNGRKIFAGDGFYLWFWREWKGGKTPLQPDYVSHNAFPMADKDILLFGVNCGGISCDPDKLHLLILDPGGSTEVVDGDDFYSADYTIMPSLAGNSFVVDLGYEQKKHKIATLHKNKILIEYLKAGKVPMQEERCKSLYANTILGDCENPATPRDCEEMRGFTGVTIAGMTDYRVSSHHPGFDTAAFGEMCVKSCQTKKAVSFEEFKTSACSL